MNLVETVLGLLFPPKCPFCKQVMEEQSVCPRCRRELPWTEGDEGLTDIPGGTVCAAPLFYENEVRSALIRLKFNDARHLAEPLGELLAQCAAERLSGRFDAVAWVPVGPKRLKKRGYDQAELLARAACRRWNTAPERLLTKIGDNPAQSLQDDAEARRANVLGMYEAAGAAGRRILLIDDICTTGATLGECVRVLREAGAADVVCAAVARSRPRFAGTARPGAENAARR